MIGNDIVDLRDSDARPTDRTPAFDARVFTPAECQRISASPDGVGERWLTWGAKEAAYKLARKRDATVAFIPLRFEVVLGVERSRPGLALAKAPRRFCGRVHWGDSVFDCDWVLAENFVHAICRLPGAKAPECQAVERIEGLHGGFGSGQRGNPSFAVRRLALAKIARFLAVDERALEIRKHDRIPCLWHEGEPLAGDLTLSHHGAMVAFAWEPPSGHRLGFAVSPDWPDSRCASGTEAAKS